MQDFAHLDDYWPPRCAHCGGVRRPAVVLFGEALPAAALADYEAAMQDDIDAVLVIGTSAVFEYIAAPVVAARRRGCTIIEINPVATSISGLCTICCRGRAAELLPAVESGLVARR